MPVLPPPSRNPVSEKKALVSIPLISGGEVGESAQVFNGTSVAADGKISATEVDLGRVGVVGTDTDRPKLLVVPVVR